VCRASAGAQGECQAETRGGIPLKSQRLLRLEATVVDCYEFIEAQKANYSIAMMCRALQVSRASFYRWRQPRQPSPRQVRHQQLVEAVKAEYTAAEGMAGRRQLTRLLNTKGAGVPESTPAAIIGARELRAIRRAA